MDVNYNENAVGIFKCLGDATRFEIVRMLMEKDSYVELLASRLSLTPPTVSFHMKKLEKAGLVECSRTQFYIIYSLKRDVFSRTVASFFETPEAADDPEAKYREHVLSSFTENGRLTHLPAQFKKREIILAHIADGFETGRDYTEKEVSVKIAEFADDYCTVRRELIGLGYFTRDRGIYRRLK